MSPIAITMLAVSIGTVWGGLALALLNLRRSPADDAEDEPQG